MNVLLIEDDPVTAKSVGLAVAAEGMVCDEVKLGIEGLEICNVNNYDIIILDLMLPDIDGYEVLLRLRQANNKIPVLILSGLSSEDQKIKGLNLGADDFLTKPFNMSELIGRIQAIVRRSKSQIEEVTSFDKVSINLTTRTVEVGGKRVHLTNKEYAVLELLAKKKGSVLSKEMLMNHLYRGMGEPKTKIIDVFLCKLRQKLADMAGGTNYIETVWGRGYMLKDFEF
jgi:DNA-binding response OmpR family regulator